MTAVVVAILSVCVLVVALVAPETVDRPKVVEAAGLPAQAGAPVGGAAPSATATNASVSPPPASPATAAAAAELGRTPLGGYPSRLAYDAATESLWYAIFDIAGPDRLVRVDTKSGRTTTYAIPDADYNGYLSTVRAAPDGAVWLTQPYRLVRFDPSSGTSSSLDLPIADEGAVAGALDPGNPVPGTWISSFAFADGGAVMARNNDPHLYSVGLDLRVGAATPVPRAHAGALDLCADPVGGGIFALPGLGQNGGVALLAPGAGLARAVAAQGHRFACSGTAGVVAGAPEGVRWLDGSPVVTAGSTAGSIDDLAALAPDGSVVVFDARTPALERVVDGAVVDSLALWHSDVTIHGPDGDVKAHAETRINDLIVDVHGVTWYIDGGTNELVRVKL